MPRVATEAFRIYQRAYREKHRLRLNAKEIARYREMSAEDKERRRVRSNEVAILRRAARSEDTRSFQCFQMVLRQHGLTLDQYHAMAERQNFCCAICEVDIVSAPSRQVHVDHDHTTGKVRGVLCGTCNTGLGKMGDGRLFAAATRYLNRGAKAA